MELAEECGQLVAYARKLRPDGLVVGTSGNLSVRSADRVAVTPSGLDYDELTPELVCVTDLTGAPVEGTLRPTTEMPFHLAVYRETAHTAVVHTHSTAATVVSTLVEELPPIHYLMAQFGGPVRVTPYRSFGTPELARALLDGLADRTGVILGNHGAVTVGSSLAEAYSRSLYLEWLCEVWLRASAHGDPRLIAADELARVGDRMASYGQQAPS